MTANVATHHGVSCVHVVRSVDKRSFHHTRQPNQAHPRNFVFRTRNHEPRKTSLFSVVRSFKVSTSLTPLGILKQLNVSILSFDCAKVVQFLPDQHTHSCQSLLHASDVPRSVSRHANPAISITSWNEKGEKKRASATDSPWTLVHSHRPIFDPLCPGFLSTTSYAHDWQDWVAASFLLSGSYFDRDSDPQCHAC